MFEARVARVGAGGKLSKGAGLGGAIRRRGGSATRPDGMGMGCGYAGWLRLDVRVFCCRIMGREISRAGDIERGGLQNE